MVNEHFEKWLINTENKKEQTAYNYSKAINRISKHYSENTNQNLNLYSLTELDKLKNIADLYGTSGKFSEFGHVGNGTNRAAINSSYRFRQNTANIDFPTNEKIEDIDEPDFSDNSNNFSYERDLKSSIVYQISELFPDYKIYGTENDGVEYLIGGKRIDLLLEKNDGSLLAIELKSGVANYKVFGQISMYLGLLMDKFPEKKEIKGCIIAGEIDDTLKRATKITDLVTLMTYTMKLELTKENL
ncbi:hypothetical protein OE09_1017 [Flavobacteriaceae bacterium MAR_2010_72]|nr:hypothetical protein OE09_1017 [Flavobacteriaceae bacterium MAR_2010_72]